jgi:hypothetical protein
VGVACFGAETSEVRLTVHFVLVYLDIILSVILFKLVIEVTRTTHYHILKVNFEFPVLVSVETQSFREVFLKNGPSNSLHRSSSRRVLRVNLSSNIHQLGNFVNSFLYCFIINFILIDPTACWLKFQGHRHVLSITEGVIQASFSRVSKLFKVTKRH